VFVNSAATNMAEEFLLEAQKAFKEKLQKLEEEFKAKIEEAKQESQFIFNAIDEKYHKDTQQLKVKQEEEKESFERRVEREKEEFAKRQEAERESFEAKQLKELSELEDNYKKDHAQATQEATLKMKTVQPNLSFETKVDTPTNDIGKELECPVCFNQMRPPLQIWQCGQGHAICETCKTNPQLSNTCPNCRKKIANRNTGMEKIALAHFGTAPEEKFVTFISEGSADKMYHHIMGKYGKLTTTFSNFPVYQRLADEEPLFLFVNESGGWVVSDTLQSGSAWLHNQTSPTPKVPPTWNWMFYNVAKDEWNEDATLRLVNGANVVNNKRKRTMEEDVKPVIEHQQGMKIGYPRYQDMGQQKGNRRQEDRGSGKVVVATAITSRHNNKRNRTLSVPNIV